MPKKAASSEKKSVDKKAGGGKGAQKADDSSDKPTNSKGKGALKAATAVNVRHILCEKHGKATEALQKKYRRVNDLTKLLKNTLRIKQRRVAV